MKKIMMLAGLAVSLALCSSAAFAANLWNTDATGELSGSRDNSAMGGLLSTGTWDDALVSLSWDITSMAGPGGVLLWTYTYTFDTSNVLTAKAVSHFILEVSDGDVEIESVYDPMDLDGPKPWALDGNTDLPGDGLMWGIKFDFGGEDDSTVYTFTTDRSPVYGSFFAKGGSMEGNVLYNVAMGIPDNTLPCDDMSADCLALMDATNWIVRPNGPIVPLPAGVWLFGSALIGLVGFRRHKAAI